MLVGPDVIDGRTASLAHPAISVSAAVERFRRAVQSTDLRARRKRNAVT